MRRSDENKPVPAAAHLSSAQTHKMFILRIVKKLEQAGLVKTVRGPKGGILLTRPGDEITLYDVFMATKEGETIYKIHETNERCQIGNNVTDVLNSVQNDLNKAIYKKLSKQTVSDLTDKILSTSHKKIDGDAFYTNFRVDPGNNIKPKEFEELMSSIDF